MRSGGAKIAAARVVQSGDNRVLRLALGLALLLAAPVASAQCSLIGNARVTFTGYTPFGGAAYAAADVRYRCRPAAEAWLSVSAPRVVTQGGDALVFELYQDAGRTSAWPAGIAVPVPGAEGENVVTLYAELPPLQDAAAASYRGSVTVSLYAGTPGSLADTGTVDVRADVADACLIDPGALAFGGYDALAATPHDAAGSLSIACTRGTSYAVGLGLGSAPAGTTRQMSLGAGRLQYELYLDPARTTVWSTTTTASGVAPSTARVVLPVYGRIPAGQAVVAGPYADTVQSTVNF